MTKFPNLQRFSLAGCPVTSLNFSSSSSLNNLYLVNTQISSVNFTGLSDLTHLVLDDNNLLSSVNFAGLSDLTHLWLYNNNLLSSVNFAGLSGLTHLYFRGNTMINTVDFTPLTNLTNLDIIGTSAETLDLSVLTNLEFLLSNYHNELISMDISGLLNLNEISIDSCNLLNSIDLSGSSVKWIAVTNCPLVSTINNENTPELNVINLNGLPSFNSIDLSDNTSITGISMQSVNIETLDISGLINLEWLALPDNSNLQQLIIEENNLSSFNNLTLLGNTPLSSANFDLILNKLDASGILNGNLYIPNRNGTSESSGAIANLISKGWSVIYLLEPGLSNSISIPDLVTESSASFRIGTSTGYVKFTYPDGTEELRGWGMTYADGNYSTSFSCNGIVTTGGITITSCNSNAIPSGNIELLHTEYCNFDNADFNSLPDLISLEIRYNNTLTSLDVSNHPTLKFLTGIGYCNSLQSVNIDSCSNLLNVQIYNNPIVDSLNYSNLDSLTSAYISNNPQLGVLDFSQYPNASLNGDNLI
jgi:hypothetical protein